MEIYKFKQIFLLILCAFFLQSFTILTEKEKPGHSAKTSNNKKVKHMEDIRNELYALMDQVPQDQRDPLTDIQKGKIETYFFNKKEFTGIALWTIPEIDISDPTLPGLIVAMKDSTRLNKQINVEKNQLLVVAPLDRGAVNTATVYPPPIKLPIPDADEDEETKETVRSGSTQFFDIRSRLVTDLRPGQHAITIIEQDWISNVEVVDITDKKGAEAARQNQGYFLEDAIGFSERMKQKKAVLFNHTENNPNVEGEGVKVALPAMIQLNGSEPNVYGAVRLKARKEWIVLNRLREQPAESQETKDLIQKVQDQPDMIPKALVNGTVLFVQPDITSPQRINLQIPIFAKKNIELGEIIDGYFAANLSATFDESLYTDTYWVYLIVGNHIDGPHEVFIDAPEE
jgi:hypothetical protein